MGRITTTTYSNRGWVATVTDPLEPYVDLLVYADRPDGQPDAEGHERRDGTVSVQLQRR